MNKITPIQKEILKIYSEIKKICDKNYIRYYAVGGTELGAVRHQGFIPWDDDMDLGIPIEDFEKFKKACKKELPKNLEFLESNWMGGKVHNKNTTFLEAQCIFDKKQYYGVFVDIFLIIGIPNNPSERRAFLEDMRRYRIKAFTFDHYPNSSVFSEKEILNWKYHLTHDYDYKTADTLAMFSTGHYFFIDPAGLKNPIEMPFENTTIPVSSKYQKTLREHYGDYMKLPPKEKRVSHNKYAIVDLKTPCKKYYKKVSKIDPKILQLLHLKHELEGIYQDDLFNRIIDYEKLAEKN